MFDSDREFVRALRDLLKFIRLVINNPPREVVDEAVEILKKTYSEKQRVKISVAVVAGIAYYVLVYKHRLVDAKTFANELRGIVSMKLVRRALIELASAEVISLRIDFAEIKRREVEKLLRTYETDQEIIQRAIEILRSADTRKIIHKRSDLLALTLIYLARKQLNKSIAKTTLIRKIISDNNRIESLSALMRYYARDIAGKSF